MRKNTIRTGDALEKLKKIPVGLSLLSLGFPLLFDIRIYQSVFLRDMLGSLKITNSDSNV